MQIEQPPFANPREHLSFREKAELSPLVVPVLMYILGIVTDFRVGTMPNFVIYLTFAFAIIGGIITSLKIIRLRTRLAYVLICVFVVFTYIAVIGVGWARGELRRSRWLILQGGTKQHYRAIVMQSTPRERTIGLDLVIVDGKLKGLKLKATIWKNQHRRMPEAGHAMDIISTIKPLEINGQSSASGFNYDRWAFSHGFNATTFISNRDWILQQAHWDELDRFDALQLKAHLWQQQLMATLLEIDGDRGGVAVAAAMTLGDKQAIPKDVRRVYSITGAGHLLALSGWHLGLIYFLFLSILPARRYRLFSLIITTIAIWFYVVVVGMPISAIRAAVMFTIYAMADVSGRGRQSLNTIALAVLIILSVEPAACFDVGFQMSVMAVVGISLFYKPLCSLLHYSWFKLIAISVAAQIGVAPLIACYFHTFSTYFILTNLVAMPIASVGVYAAAVSLVLLPFNALHTLAVLIAQSACECLNYLLSLISALPASYLTVNGVDFFDIMLMYFISVCYVVALVRLRRIAEKRHRQQMLIDAGYAKKKSRRQQTDDTSVLYDYDDE